MFLSKSWSLKIKKKLFDKMKHASRLLNDSTCTPSCTGTGLRESYSNWLDMHGSPALTRNMQARQILASCMCTRIYIHDLLEYRNMHARITSWFMLFCLHDFRSAPDVVLGHACMLGARTRHLRIIYQKQARFGHVPSTPPYSIISLTSQWSPRIWSA